uniref:Tetratricopeptide repeat protein n=1 Tax=Streptomyces sp. NBC_00049 TaxID=2903617 RepID=A0AAU2K2J8_9ACTN
MHPDQKVVQLCVRGMAAEAEGRDAAARDLFRQAWDSARDDYEACVSAHYLARHQPTPEAALHWNRTCLELADRVGDERVRGFYPSLHGTIGRALLDLGRPGEARAHFEAAADRLGELPPGPYADWLRLCIARGLRATAPEPAPVPGAAGADRLRLLLARLCERADLEALSLVLPSYTGNLHRPEDEERLTTALRMLQAERRLPEADQAVLSEVIGIRAGS